MQDACSSTGGSAWRGRHAPVAVARPAHPPLALALADQGRFLVRRFLGTLACTGLVTQSAKKSPEEQLGRRTRTERCQVRSSGLSNLQSLSQSPLRLALLNTLAGVTDGGHLRDCNLVLLSHEPLNGIVWSDFTHLEHARRPQRQTSAPASPASRISSHLRPCMPNL